VIRFHRCHRTRHATARGRSDALHHFLLDIRTSVTTAVHTHPKVVSGWRSFVMCDADSKKENIDEDGQRWDKLAL
jgi:hypothetical protein